MSDDLKELRRKIARLGSELNLISSDQDNILFKDFAVEYAKQKMSNPTLRGSTKRSFHNQLENHLLPAFGNLPIMRIKNGEWIQWVSDMLSQKKMSSFFNSRKALIEILRAAHNDGHIEKIPKLDNPDRPKDVGRVLAQSEILAIIWKSRRPFRFIFFCFWKMGCRPSEILQWEWSMIRCGLKDNPSWIDIPASITKTGRKRSIPINQDIVRILSKRISNTSFVFPSRNDRLKPQRSYKSAWDLSCLRAGIINATPYDLRRTFITRCAAEGKPLIYVAKLLDTSVEMIEKVYSKAQTEVMMDIIK